MAIYEGYGMINNNEIMDDEHGEQRWRTDGEM
jgi:hypothetical protein